MREGVRAALAVGIKNLTVEGDNLAIINYLGKTWKVPWEIHALVADARVDLVACGNVMYSHCFRKANQAADFLAHKGHTYDFSFLSTIRKDVLGWSYFRN